MAYTSTQRMMIAALVEAPAGMGSSLGQWLMARTGCSRNTAYKYARMRSGLLPLSERRRLIAEARLTRRAELAAGQDTNELPADVVDYMATTAEEGSYAAAAGA